MYTIEKRSASAPTRSMSAIGSGELPSVFDILRPFSSRTIPWMSTRENGTSPMNAIHAMIMRATQKKRISLAVTSTSLGK